MSEGNPCGHETRQPGCGGCDPSAIEFVIPDGQPIRPFYPDLDLVVRPVVERSRAEAAHFAAQLAKVQQVISDTATTEALRVMARIAAAGEQPVSQLAVDLVTAEAAIGRVRDLHHPSTDHGEAFDPYCVGCFEAGGMDGAPSYPCPTIRALNGDPA